MMKNQVSATLTQENVNTLLSSAQVMEAILSFMVGLSPEQRKALAKGGDGAQGFIRKAYEVGQLITDYLPRGMDLAEMKKDIDLMDQLYPVMIAISKLSTKLTDTYALACSEAYSAALLIYKNAKEVKGDEGLEQPIAELKRRFARRAPTGTDQDGAQGQGGAEPDSADE